MTDHVLNPDDAPRQVSAEATRFLTLIGREAPLLFRAIFDDREKRNTHGFQPVERTGTFAQHAQDLRRLNDAGFGIFVQVNVADGKGWKGPNIIAATCLFADFDGVPLENVDRLGLRPHVVAETSPGKRHYYWRVADIPINQHQAFQKRLIRLFDSDKSVHDLPRLMRLPGFLHLKNPDAPHLVQIVETFDAPPYALDVFEIALEAAETSHGMVPDKEGKRLPSPPEGASVLSIASSGDTARNLEIYELALRHSIAKQTVDLGDRSEWVRVGIALKASAGEAGFVLWARLSSEAEGFVSEDDCRNQWATFRDDLPEEKRLTMATFIANAQYTGWTLPRRGQAPGMRLATDLLVGEDFDGGCADRGDENARSDKVSGKTDPGIIVIEQAADAGDELWVDTENRPHVTFDIEQRGIKRRVSARVNSDLYRGKLAEGYLVETGKKMLPREQANLAIDVMEHRARTHGDVREAAIRVAEHDGAIYVDHGRADGKVTCIDTTGYSVRDTCPVAFVQGREGELPLAEAGGSLADFERHFNLTRADLMQVIGFAVAAFKPKGPFAILLIEGAAGSAKTSLLDKLMLLGDPPQALEDVHMAPPRSERDLQIEAAGTRIVSLDNLKHVPDDQADWYCRLATGGSTSVRQNYRDDKAFRHRAMRPTIITCIGTPSKADDFLSRCLRVTAAPIANPLPDALVLERFLKDRPRMLGFLFNCVSAALRELPAVNAAVDAGEIRTSRMATFATFVEGAAELLGMKRGEFSAMLRSGQAVMQAESALGDPFGAAVIRYFSGDAPHGGAGSVLGAGMAQTTLEGSATEVLALLRGYEPDSRDWPPVNQLKERLRRIGPGLRDLGVEWEFRKASGHVNKSTYLLTRTEAFVPVGQAKRG